MKFDLSKDTSVIVTSFDNYTSPYESVLLSVLPKSNNNIRCIIANCKYVTIYVTVRNRRHLSYNDSSSVTWVYSKCYWCQRCVLLTWLSDPKEYEPNTYI